MNSSSSTITKPSKKPKITIIPPRSSLINSTIDNDLTSNNHEGYLHSSMSPPPRVGPPLPTQSLFQLDLTLSLSPFTPLDDLFASSLSPPPMFINPPPWGLLETHGDSCPCCIHNRTLITCFKDELDFIFASTKSLLSQLSQQSASSSST